MATDPRRFDDLTRAVRDLQLQQSDSASTLATRLAGHKHVEADTTSLVTDLSTLTTNVAGKAATGHTHSSIVNGTPSLAVGSSTTLTNQPILWDTSWQFFSFVNGWIDGGFARFRLMPDGTTLFRGWTTKPTSNAVNGEIMFSIPYPYYPSTVMNFPTSCSGRASNGLQKCQVDSSGNCRVWDPAVALGDMDINGIQFPSQYLN